MLVLIDSTRYVVLAPTVDKTSGTYDYPVRAQELATP